MAKVGPGKGRDGRIRVYFRGELRLLSALANEQRVHQGTVLGKWHREGKQNTIADDFFDQVRAAQKDPNSAKYYSVEGVRYSARQMVKKFGLTQSTLDNRRARNGKTDYTTVEIEEMLRNKTESAAKIGRSWGGRGPSEPPPFGHDLTLIEKAALRFAAW